MPIKKPTSERVAMDSKITIENPATDVPRALAQVQEQAVRLADRDDLRGQELANVVEAIENIDMAVKAQVEKHDAIEKVLTSLGRPGAARDNGALRNLYMRKPEKEWAGKVSPGYWTAMAYTPEEHGFNPLARGVSAFTANTRGNVLDEDTRAFIRHGQFLNDALLLYGRHQAELSRNMTVEQYMRGCELWPMWRGWVEDFQQRASVAADTQEVGAGKEWVPTMFSTLLVEVMRDNLAVAGFFDVLPMPRSPFGLPVLGATLEGFYAPENTAATGQTAPEWKHFTTLDLTFTARTLMSLVLASMELDEDSIVPYAETVLRELGRSQAETLEQAILNGQVSATIDTGDSFTTTYDARYAFDGLRYQATLPSNFQDLSGGFTAEACLKMKSVMDRFGYDPAQGVWIMGYIGYARALALKDTSGTAVVLTADKAAGAPTFGTGALGAMFGSPIVVSGKYPRTLNATTGVIDGVSATTGMLYANRRMERLGTRRIVNVDMSRERFFEYNQLAWKATWRGHFKSVVAASSTYPFVCGAAGITSF